MKRIINAERLSSHGNIHARELALDITEHGLLASDPYYNARQLMHMEGDTLVFEGSAYEAEGDPHAGAARYSLIGRRVFLFAIGKGIQRVAKAVEDLLGGYLTGGYVIAKHGDPVIMEHVEVMLGGHPVPDEYCVAGCRRMLDIIREARLTSNDLVITAIGNGVSSLMTYPVAGVSLKDVIRCVEILQVENGLPTSELNDIRNQIDLLKGGRISKYLLPAQTVHLLAVPPNVNDTAAAKGYEALIHCNYWLHTLPDATSRDGALRVLHSRGVWGLIPASIQKALLHCPKKVEGIRPEEIDSSRVFALLPEERDAVSIGMKRAQELGLTPYLLTRKTQCEAGAAGRFVAQMARCCVDGGSPFHRPCALFVAGELLVTCGEHPGVGGRNQEYCLAAAIALEGYSQIALCGVDTDGTDGPGGRICEAAEAQGIKVLGGGLVDGSTCARAKEKGVDLRAALVRHSASEALWQLEDGVIMTHNVSIGDLSCCVIL